MSLLQTITTQYGTLTFNEKYKFYEGKFSTGDYTFYATADIPEDASEQTAVIGRIEMLAGDIASFDRKCRAYAAEVLLDSANEWLEDSDDEDKPDEYTEEMFMELMALESVDFRLDGGIQIYYNDGDMFWGHCIYVDVSPEGECLEADIAG